MADKETKEYYPDGCPNEPGKSRILKILYKCLECASNNNRLFLYEGWDINTEPTDDIATKDIVCSHVFSVKQLENGEMQRIIDNHNTHTDCNLEPLGIGFWSGIRINKAGDDK